MPNFVLNGFEFYNAPKNGGTTVRMWLKYAEGGLPADFSRDGYYTLAKVGMPRQWTDTVMVPQPFFQPGAEGNRRWCITRDPVERFISAYTDKILLERLASSRSTLPRGMRFRQSGYCTGRAKQEHFPTSWPSVSVSCANYWQSGRA